MKAEIFSAKPEKRAFSGHQERKRKEERGVHSEDSKGRALENRRGIINFVKLTKKYSR